MRTGTPLEDSLDPCMIVDGQGRVIWHNARAELLFSQFAGGGKLDPRPFLSELIGKDLTAQVLHQKNFAILPMHLELGAGQRTSHSLLVLDVSGANPDQARYLLTLKPAWPSALQLESDDSLSTITHDLKNPISAIFGYADALLDTPTGKGLSDKHRSILGRIRSTAARAIDLVRNLQHLSEPRSKLLAKPASTVELNTLIRSAVESTWREDQDAPKLRMQLYPEPLPVRIDRVQLDRLFGNILSNALRYTPVRGEILISSKAHPVGASFTVQNTGNVIPPDELPFIFDKHRRASSSLGKPGSGLGLYIVRQIVEANGGTVQVQSTPQEGTSFTVFIPGG